MKKGQLVRITNARELSIIYRDEKFAHYSYQENYPTVAVIKMADKKLQRISKAFIRPVNIFDKIFQYKEYKNASKQG